ncbi:collagen-binding domain-containing protein [Actinomadura hibisca]|uniref:collagen-binding domain-containing protein n=1 Tax=Actinomadura hibisca TaxID=68565 RepID=UPI00082E2B56|nr:collagen-binding domain-containing protein [Actinomadura hibisca]
MAAVVVFSGLAAGCWSPAADASGGAAAVRASGNPVAGNHGFTVVTAGNATVSSNENEGTMAVGGDLTIADTYNVNNRGQGAFTASGDARATALVVNGKVNLAGSANAPLRVLGSGYVKIGDLSGAGVRTTDDNGAKVDTVVNRAQDGYNTDPAIRLTVRQPGPSVGPARPLDFAAMFKTYRARARELAGCRDNVKLRDDAGQPLSGAVPPGARVRISLTTGKTNVLRLSKSDLANIATLQFDDKPTRSAPLMIVVTGSGALTWTPPTMNLSSQDAPYLLFNLPDITSVTMPDGGGGSVEGTIFAPNAVLTDHNSNNVEGNLILAGLRHGGTGGAGGNGGEIHPYPFDADLNCVPVAPSSDNPGPKPKPRPNKPQPSKPQPKLTVVKSASQQIVRVGRTVSFELRATNTGKAVLDPASFDDDVRDVLRHGRLVGGVRASTGLATLSGGHVRWRGRLAPGGTATITYKARLTRPGTARNIVTWPQGPTGGRKVIVRVYPLHAK